MTHDDLVVVVTRSAPEDWLDDEEYGLTLKSDLNVRIVREQVEGDRESRRFFHDWATKRYPNEAAYVARFRLFYGASHVRAYDLVFVDGRAWLPIPLASPHDLSVTHEHYHIACILNSGGPIDTDSYRDRSKLIIQLQPQHPLALSARSVSLS